MSASENLAAKGIVLPEVAAPVAAYVPATVVGNQVWTSGQLPLVEGALPATGKVGEDISLEDATAYTRTAALNALAAINAQVGIDNVTRIAKVVVYVSSATDFTQQPAVANGASELMAEVFGEKGAHVRSAVGVAVLPLDSPVEVEVVAEFAG